MRADRASDIWLSFSDEDGKPKYKCVLCEGYETPLVPAQRRWHHVGEAGKPGIQCMEKQGLKITDMDLETYLHGYAERYRTYWAQSGPITDPFMSAQKMVSSSATHTMLGYALILFLRRCSCTGAPTKPNARKPWKMK